MDEKQKLREERSWWIRTCVSYDMFEKPFIKYKKHNADAIMNYIFVL